MIMCKDGVTIQVMGNTIHTSNGETYLLNGTCLSGPHGFVSYNVSNIDEATGMVVGIHGGRKF